MPGLFLPYFGAHQLILVAMYLPSNLTPWQSAPVTAALNTYNKARS